MWFRLPSHRRAESRVWHVALIASGGAAVAFVAAALGLTCVACALILSLLLGALGVPFQAGLVIGLVLGFPVALRLQPGLTRWFRRHLGNFERHAARKSVVTIDALHEPFALLLRGFSDEDLCAPGTATPVASMFPNRLEPWIIQAIEPVGRVIAVGRPSEELPYSGAARLYITSAEWRATVKSLIDRATAVVVLVGEGSGVWWEIDAALRCAHLYKLAFVFPFALPKDGAAVGFYRRNNLPTGRGYGPLFDRFQATVRDRLGALVPEPHRSEQVLVFDGNGRPTFLPTVMAGTYHMLRINPVYILLTLVARLFPLMPWRMSLAGEISYTRTFEPFVHRFRPRTRKRRSTGETQGR